MLIKMDDVSRASPAVLRVGAAIAFLWFGFSQIKNPAAWMWALPDYASSLGVDVKTLIFLHGIVEVALAALLLVGFSTRAVAALLALNLLHVTFAVGYGATGVRDFALALAVVAIALRGADDYCLDRILKRNGAPGIPPGPGRDALAE